MMGRIAAIYDLEVKTMLSAERSRSSACRWRAERSRRASSSSSPRGNRRERRGRGALTAATGESWLKICELLHTGKIDVRKLDQEWAKYAPNFMDVAKKLLERRVTKR